MQAVSWHVTMITSLSPHLDLQGGGIIIFILQMRKLRLREGEGLAQGLTISKWKRSNLDLFLPNATLSCRPEQPGGATGTFISQLLCLGGQGVDGEEVRGVW